MLKFHTGVVGFHLYSEASFSGCLRYVLKPVGANGNWCGQSSTFDFKEPKYVRTFTSSLRFQTLWNYHELPQTYTILTAINRVKRGY